MAAASLQHRLDSFFAAPASALDLAVVRTVVFGTLLMIGLGDPNDVRWFASLPKALFEAPPGWGPALDRMPQLPELAVALRWCFLAACLSAALGLFTRFSSCVVLLTGVYVLGLPQMVGKLNHYHHLWWFAAILAVAPCSDALALDRWRRGRTSIQTIVAGPSQVYGRPLRFIWVLIGLIYLFPGVWKLASVGLEWAWSDNLQWLLYQKWAELDGFRPLVRVDQNPWLLKCLGVFTLVFEIGFLPALFFKRLRPWFVAAGFAFHLGTWATMNIHFLELLVCYVAFVPWSRLLDRSADTHRTIGRELTADPARSVTQVGAALICLAVLFGATGTDSWPFAVYPRFNYVASQSTTVLEIETVETSGANANLNTDGLRQRFHSSRWSHLHRRLLADPENAALWFAFRELVERDLPGETSTVRYLRTRKSVDPNSTQPVFSRETIWEFAPGSVR